ncbi:MAG: alpha/beta hydrolase-fold protein [Myxococcota bacterium]
MRGGRVYLLVAAAVIGLSTGGLWLTLPRLAVWFSSPSDWPPVPIPSVTSECFDESGDPPWSFCLNRTAESDPSRLLFHLHGRRGNHHWWNDQEYYTGELYRHWERGDVAAPTVASISYGPLWLLKNTSTPTNLIQHFVETVMPTVMARLPAPVTETSVVGESMGGLNALMLAAFAGDRFDRAAILCAPIPTSSPYDLGESFVAARESGVSLTRAFMLLSFGRYFFADHDDWLRNDPIARLSSSRSSVPRVYLTCGRRDDWGCMRGSRLVAEAIRARSGALTWVPRPGGHCDVDAEGLAEFLAEPTP